MRERPRICVLRATATRALANNLEWLPPPAIFKQLTISEQAAIGLFRSLTCVVHLNYSPLKGTKVLLTTSKVGRAHLDVMQNVDGFIDVLPLAADQLTSRLHGPVDRLESISSRLLHVGATSCLNVRPG